MSSPVSQENAALTSFREIVGPNVSDTLLRSILVKARGDVTAATEMFFRQDMEREDETMGVDENSVAHTKNDSAEVDRTAPTQNSAPPVPQSASSVALIAALSELLGGDVSNADMLDLLQRSNGDLGTAVEIHFSSKAKLVESNDTVPKSATPARRNISTPVINGVYDVEINDGRLQWTIGNVLGRIVVQDVEPGGSAHSAGIKKSDVLIECSGRVIQEGNCAAIVTRLSKEVCDTYIRRMFFTVSDAII
jgi:hypothetical protein